jgi:hypothetical protein
MYAQNDSSEIKNEEDVACSSHLRYDRADEYETDFTLFERN